ncbi:unnamed protein product [Cochlearia groenlandica]
MNGRRETITVKEKKDDSESLYSLLCLTIGSIMFPDSRIGDVSSLRSLLVIAMGTIVILTTMALDVFTLFFVAATSNAIIICLLISLAVAGGFLALFFLCLAGVYIGALSFAAFVISTVTGSTVVSVLIASGKDSKFVHLGCGSKVLNLIALFVFTDNTTVGIPASQQQIEFILLRI